MNVRQMMTVGIACCALNFAPAEATDFAAELDGSLSLPALYNDNATGVARLTLSDDQAAPKLSYHPICANGLLNPARSADFYVDSVQNQQGRLSDSVTLSHETDFSDKKQDVAITKDLASALRNGRAAVTIATREHPSGEIRGLIYECPSNGCPVTPQNCSR